MTSYDTASSYDIQLCQKKKGNLLKLTSVEMI